MFLKFSGKKISGILNVIPKNEVFFDDEIENYNFSREQSLKLKSIMGYEKKRIADPGVCISDLALFGLNYLFEKNLLDKNDIDAIIVVTQTPDFIMPPTSNYIQGALGLSHDVYCLDINQGCAGFLVGLFEAYTLLSQDSISKVVLINADILSRKVSIRDRNSNPLIGDAASITIVENSKDSQPIFASIRNDGALYDSLIIPAGGMKRPIDNETSKIIQDESGNYRSLNNLVMKGDSVFNFVMTRVPPMIDEILDYSGKSKDEIDYFLFHQPNKFMLSKLAAKIGIGKDKMPSNIVENFGNSSGASIPTVISYNLSDKLYNNSLLCCLAGFGVGLTWASQVLNIGPLSFNHIVEF